MQAAIIFEICSGSLRSCDVVVEIAAVVLVVEEVGAVVVAVVFVVVRGMVGDSSLVVFVIVRLHGRHAL